MRRALSTGEDQPSPGTGAFHATLLVLDQCTGTLRAFECPWPSGPRNCGQSSACAAAAASSPLNKHVRTALFRISKQTASSIPAASRRYPHSTLPSESAFQGSTKFLESQGAGIPVVSSCCESESPQTRRSARPKGVPTTSKQPRHCRKCLQKGGDGFSRGV